VYDELGQLVQKKLGDNIQTVDYQYNIRGWLTRLNNPTNLGDDLFGMELKYNTGVSVLSADAQFNGNISAMTWAGSQFDGMRTYGFTYDALNRLSQARYGEGSTYNDNLDQYKVSIGSYDWNGNIVSLDRYLKGSLMDQMVYTYDGNQLKRVSDTGDKQKGFIDGETLATEYDYDLNGNMKMDMNKGLTNVAYNHLNLPKKVVADGEYIDYIYDALGTKLAKKVRTATTEDVHYRGSFVYRGSSLDYLIHDEGLIDIDGSTTTYQYYLKAHLGNTRAVFTDKNGTAQLEQEQHYYPVGMVMDGLKYNNSTPNKYLYNGKELQDDQLGSNKLDWLDYGATMYDAQIGRWHCIDPLAESYYSQSSYHFSGNNPIRFIDDNGMNYGDYFDAEGAYLGNDGIDDDKVYLVKKNSAVSSDTKTQNIVVNDKSEVTLIGGRSDFLDMNGYKISSEGTKNNLIGLSINMKESGVTDNYEKITVVSGDRSAARNKKAGGAKKSAHLLGVAADIKVKGMSNETLANAANSSGLFSGVIYYPAMGETRRFGERTATRLIGKDDPMQYSVKFKQKLWPHVHVDNKPRKYSYFGMYIGHNGVKNKYKPYKK
jgi:RHS repeat-associated protein